MNNWEKARRLLESSEQKSVTYRAFTPYKARAEPGSSMSVAKSSSDRSPQSARSISLQGKDASFVGEGVDLSVEQPDKIPELESIVDGVIEKNLQGKFEVSRKTGQHNGKSYVSFELLAQTDGTSNELKKLGRQFHTKLISALKKAGWKVTG